MLIDFQHHFTPPELMEAPEGGDQLKLDEAGNPNYRFNSLLANLPAHVRMMDRADIDAAVLSCGQGFDQPNVATCRLINDRMRQAERDHPGRFIGLAHVPALNPKEATTELKRCAIELGFPGVVIASELQGQPLDAEGLLPFWNCCPPRALRLHPSSAASYRLEAHGCGRPRADARLGILPNGWLTVRLINSGLLDQLPTLKILVSHFAGGICRYLPRICGLQQRENSGTASIPRHNRQPKEPFEDYLHHRLFYDCAGWAGPDHAAERGAEWIRIGLGELPASRVVFATDYPQAVRDADEVLAYVDAVRALGCEARTVLDDANAKKLIPNLNERLKASAR